MGRFKIPSNVVRCESATSQFKLPRRSYNESFRSHLLVHLQKDTIVKQGSEPVSWRKPGPDGTKTTEQLGNATFFIYETVQEAVDHLGEAKLLDRLNAQVETDAKNALRATLRPGEPNKTALKNMAAERIPSSEYSDIITAGAARGLNAMQAIEERLDKEIEKIKEERKAAAGASADDDSAE